MPFCRASIILSSLILGVLLSSCSQPPVVEEKKPAPVALGRIHKVFPSKNFVLVKKETLVAMPEQDTVLLSQDDSASRIANLVVSGERLSTSPIFPADIRSGEVKQGDRVFIYSSIEDGKTGVRILDPIEDKVASKPDAPIEAHSDESAASNIERDEDLPEDIKEYRLKEEMPQ